MKARRRRKYRRNKALERYFARWRAEFGLTCPHKYRAIERWLGGYGLLPFYSPELGEEFKDVQ